MSETYGELVTRLYWLRDQTRKTYHGRIALGEVINTLVFAAGRGITYGKAKELIGYEREEAE